MSCVVSGHSAVCAGQKKKKQQPLKFKVGTGQVIRGVRQITLIFTRTFFKIFLFLLFAC